MTQPIHRVLLILGGVAGSLGAQPLPTTATRGWPILADGRVKPLETFAREQVTAITGRSALDGLSALDILWGFHLGGDGAGSLLARPYLRIDSTEVKQRVGLDQTRKRYSFDELMANREFQQLVESATERKRTGAELIQVERDGLEIYHRMEMVDGLRSGSALGVVPVLREGGAWSTPADLAHATEPAQRAVFEGFVRLREAWTRNDALAFDAAARELHAGLGALNPGVYPAAAEIGRELLYNDLNLFGRAWVLYLLGFLVVLLFGFGRRRGGYWAGDCLLVLGLAAHTWGLGLRWAIAGRAPVSDMYESLVFMSWGALALALVLEVIYRTRHFALTGGLAGFLTLMFAEHLPLDSSINPLVPVLAHTSWLAIHVMTIMLSYSAFALVMVLGHVVIGIQLFRPGKTEQLRNLSTLLHKALQAGLLFLAAGIVFGAVWANESWGRYWGWDPKETWSLITFFVYLAIVHARFAGWLQNFGLAVGAIVGFLSVLMTYYGVNFVLGAGLHSYGFASGGALWVGGYLALEVAFVVVAFLRYRTAVRQGWIPRPAPT